MKSSDLHKSRTGFSLLRLVRDFLPSPSIWLALFGSLLSTSAWADHTVNLCVETLGHEFENVDSQTVLRSERMDIEELTRILASFCQSAPWTHPQGQTPFKKTYDLPSFWKEIERELASPTLRGRYYFVLQYVSTSNNLLLSEKVLRVAVPELISIALGQLKVSLTGAGLPAPRFTEPELNTLLPSMIEALEKAKITVNRSRITFNTSHFNWGVFGSDQLIVRSLPKSQSNLFRLIVHEAYHLNPRASALRTKTERTEFEEFELAEIEEARAELASRWIESVWFARNPAMPEFDPHEMRRGLRKTLELKRPNLKTSDPKLAESNWLNLSLPWARQKPTSTDQQQPRALLRVPFE